MEQWQMNNIFYNSISQMVLIEDFLDTVFSNFRQKCKHKNIELTRELAEETLYNFIHEEMDYAIDEILDEYFDDEEEDDD